MEKEIDTEPSVSHSQYFECKKSRVGEFKNFRTKIDWPN